MTDTNELDQEDKIDIEEDQNVAGDIDQSEGALRRTSRVFKRFALFLFALLGLSAAGLLILQSVSLSNLQSLNSTIHFLSPILTAIRCSFLAALVIYWNPIIAYLGRRNEWAAEKTILIQQERWKFMIAVLCIELIFVQRLPKYLFM